VENGAGRAGIRGILMPIGGARTTMSQGKISDHEENERLLRGSPVSGPQALPRGNQLNHFGGLPFFAWQAAQLAGFLDPAVLRQKGG
jgi:hypothetical protein